MSMKDRVAVITGGAAGIGKACAIRFAHEGMRLVLADLDAQDGERTLQTLREMGADAVFEAGSIADEAYCRRLAAIAQERWGRLDVLVANAANRNFSRVIDATEREWNEMLAVNLKGPFRLSALIGTRMAAGTGGSIITISSTASVSPSPNAEPYGAAKSGLNNLTRSMAYVFGPTVRVNCIMAGPFLTDISKAWDLEAFNARAKDTIPLGRGGQPEEVVGAALYFASDASSFTTGAILPIEGGAHGSRGIP